MKKVYLYGAGNNGRKAMKLLRESYAADFVLAGIIDSYKTGVMDGLPIYSLEEIPLSDARIIITIFKPEITIDIFFTLREKGFHDIWWFLAFERKVYGKDFFQEQCICCEKWSKPFLFQVEMHIMDACNLNCSGCAHFSPIFPADVPNFSSRMDDIRCLAEKFAHIAVFYLLGGEPFLNPEICRYLKEVRKLLPDTELVIVSNGLLVPTLSDDVLQGIKDNNFRVSISEYLPTHKIIGDICRRLEQFEIIYDVRRFDSKETFNKPLSLRRNSQHPLLCISKNCTTIWNGKISRCPTLMYIGYFNKFFRQHLPEDGVISLDAPIAGNELLEILKRRVPLCDYCVENAIPWHTCGKSANLEDFAALD